MILAAALAALAVSSAQSVPSAAQVVLSPCRIEGAPGEARCGTYQVWEDRDAKSGRRIDLSIIVLAALEPGRLADPFFMISGGPGDAPSFNARFFSRVFHDIRKKRDLVLVDLRGTGKSAPLSCPELAQPGRDGVFDPDLLSVPAVRACRARLEQTRDLRFYTTDNAVDDLDEVRQALGYGPINLYGTSYGTVVAQVYMRRHPASLRAVSMKGIVPQSMAAPESHAPAGDIAWRSLVDRCRNDAACHDAYPLVAVEFRELLKQLEKNPVMTLAATEHRPAARIIVSRGLFAEAFRNVLYTPEGLAQAPKLVHQLVNGDDDRSLVETALSGRTVLGGERLAAGFFLSVTCTESEPYVSKDADAKAAGTFGGNYRLAQQRAACREWPRGRVSAAHRQPVTSAIPSLLLSGELDPVTPPSGGEEVVRHLSKGRHVVIRNNGHPIGNAEACIGQMIGRFLDRASADGLDVSCAAAIPAVPFVIPGKKQ